MLPAFACASKESKEEVDVLVEKVEQAFVESILQKEKLYLVQQNGQKENEQSKSVIIKEKEEHGYLMFVLIMRFI